MRVLRGLSSSSFVTRILVLTLVGATASAAAAADRNVLGEYFTQPN